MDQETSSTKVNWKSVSQLDGKDKNKIMKAMAKGKLFLKQCDEKNEKDRKNQIIAFYTRMGRKPPVSKPTNEEEEEVLACSSTTSDAQVLPEEDNP